MFRLLFRLRYVAGIALFLASFFGYRVVRVDMSDHERVGRDLAGQLAEKTTGELLDASEHAGICVAPLANDEGGRLTASLREWLCRHESRNVQPGVLTLAQEWIGVVSPPRTVAEAREAADSAGARYLLFGTVNKLNTVPDSLLLEADLKLLEANSGQIIYSKVHSVPGPNASVDQDGDSAMASAFSEGMLTRAGIWLVMILLLPMVAGCPIAGVLRKRSNGANAGMLCVYGLAIFVLGWLLWGGSGASLLSWLLLIAGTVGSLVYFGYFCSQVEQVAS